MNNQKLITIQEVADRIDIPVQTIYRWRSEGKGPRGFRVGKYVRFRLEDVEAWEQEQLDGDERAQEAPVRTDRPGLNISAALRHAREVLGINQSELARRMVDAGWSSYTQMTVSRSESGARTPSLAESADLADILHTTLDVLAGRASGSPETATQAEALNAVVAELVARGIVTRRTS